VRRGRLYGGRLRGADDGARASEARGVLLPPRAIIFALFLTPRAIWTPKEVKDWEGLFTTRKNSLSGVSRMRTLVCCELSRAKQVLVRDAQLH
jgi:hypothetical protein